MAKMKFVGGKADKIIDGIKAFRKTMEMDGCGEDEIDYELFSILHVVSYLISGNAKSHAQKKFLETPWAITHNFFVCQNDYADKISHTAKELDNMTSGEVEKIRAEALVVIDKIVSGAGQGDMADEAILDIMHFAHSNLSKKTIKRLAHAGIINFRPIIGEIMAELQDKIKKNEPVMEQPEDDNPFADLAKKHGMDGTEIK